MISCFDEKKFAKDLDVIIKYQYLCGAKRNKFSQCFIKHIKKKLPYMGCWENSIRKDGLPMKALDRRVIIGRCSDMALRCF